MAIEERNWASTTTTEEEDAPPVRLANWFSECMNVVIPLESKPAWEQFCDAVTASERKKSILWALAGLASVAPLIELPTLHGPKPMLRRVVTAAAELQPLVAAWDDTTDPSDEMVAAARRVVACMHDPESHLDLP
jgi:hypothetical protein